MVALLMFFLGLGIGLTLGLFSDFILEMFEGKEYEDGDPRKPW
jgi:hypothetical protein